MSQQSLQRQVDALESSLKHARPADVPELRRRLMLILNSLKSVDPALRPTRTTRRRPVRYEAEVDFFDNMPF